MGRRSIETIRKSELADAAFSMLTENGVRGTTLEKVAARAGVSKGVILHYFKDKNALFETVLRRSNSITSKGVTDLLRNAETPWERLYAIIIGNFSPIIFQKGVCHAWVCLCAEVPYSAQYQRIQIVIHSRMRSNLLNALKPTLPKEEADRVAVAITTLIDGIWLRAGLQIKEVSSETALSELYFTIDRILPTAPDDVKLRRKARKKMEMVAKILFDSKNQ